MVLLSTLRIDAIFEKNRPYNFIKRKKIKMIENGRITDGDIYAVLYTNL